MIGKLGRGLARLKEGLARTRDRLGDGIRALVAGRSTFDETTWDGIEEVLLGADVGTETAGEILADLKRAASGWTEPSPERIFDELRRAVGARLSAQGTALALDPAAGPAVVLVVGVNGSGKTTTIGKLAARLTQEGRRVLIVAADTYRAAAVEQLAVWAERAGVALVKGHEGADAAAVVHDGLSAALARGSSVVLVDTAGRLHTKTSLMEELSKVRRVVEKRVPGAPHEVLLVLDATTGQNGVRQAEAFSKSLGVTGLVLAKLDGTAKGGVVLAIRRALDLPVKLIGVGEGIEDLETFDPVAFAEALVPAAAEGKEA
ncbi:MAG: signal recognition particle-docking protein FtsY [bacterium]